MKLRLLLSVVGLLFGIGIISVSMMTSVNRPLAGNSSVADKEMYLGEVLPDHLGYPVVAAIDRFYLETANPTERIQYQVKYSHRRLYYTQSLLAKGEETKDLALSTLTKSQKYLLKACQELAQNEVDDSTTQLVIRALAYNINQVEDLTHQFPDSQRTIIDELRAQEQAALEQLQH